MIDFVFQKMRSVIVGDTQIFNIIGTRCFPQNVDLESDTNIYPLMAYALVGGFPDQDNYGSNDLLIDISYVSDNSLDQSIKLYQRTKVVLNTEVFSDTVNSNYFKITEDSTPFDGSGLYGDKFLYVYNNIYRVKTIET